MNQQLKASVNSWDFDYLTAIYIYVDGNEKIRVLKLGEKSNKWNEFDPGEKINPTIILNTHETRVLYEALDEFYRKKGQPPDSDAKLQGKLEATERHLEDMRKMTLSKY